MTKRNILKVIYTEINRIPPVALVARYWRDKTAILRAERHFATGRTDVFIQGGADDRSPKLWYSL
jgi:hypothetical protein